MFMGAEEDVRRQALNVFRMKILGAKRSMLFRNGTQTLRDATSGACSDTGSTWRPPITWVPLALTLQRGENFPKCYWSETKEQFKKLNDGNTRYRGSLCWWRF